MRLLKPLLLCALTTLTLNAHAFNADFLTYTPGFYFTKEDWKLATDTAHHALEYSKDGAKLSWQNPKTQAHGYYIPSKTHGNCRELLVAETAHGVSSQTQYRFCKVNNEWTAQP